VNFDIATIRYPDGRVSKMTQVEFYAVPLGERIKLLTGGCIKFEKDKQTMSPMDALRIRK